VAASNEIDIHLLNLSNLIMITEQLLKRLDEKKVPRNRRTAVISARLNIEQACHSLQRAHDGLAQKKPNR
jgi:hypothetical protein